MINPFSRERRDGKGGPLPFQAEALRLSQPRRRLDDRARSRGYGGGQGKLPWLATILVVR